MSKRKILLVAMSICMIAILAIGGSLAFFTDDEQKHNTMVIGNVDIDIDELTYMDEDGDGEREWGKFVDDEFVLYPLPSAQGSVLFNKMVYTFNNSANGEAVYMRSFVLIEEPATEEYDAAELENNPVQFMYSNTTSGTSHGVKRFCDTVRHVEIDGVRYAAYVYVEVDEKAIPAGEKMVTLSSVYFHESVTQEIADIYGDKVDIIVFTQAIQSTGLTHAAAMEALGEISADNIKAWVTGAPEATINDHYTFE